MNPTFQAWFESGKIIEALCGEGNYFIPNHTYRDQHDDLLAVRTLLKWSAQGNSEKAARGFEMAVTKLLEEVKFKKALHLLLSYGILKKSSEKILSIDEDCIEARIAKKVQEQPEQFVKSEELRKTLILVISYFPNLGKKTGVNKKFTITDKFEMILD